MDGAARPLGGTALCVKDPQECTRARGVCRVCGCVPVRFLTVAWFHSHWADEEMRPATFHRSHETLTGQQHPRDPNPSLSPAGGLQPRHMGVT